MTDQERADNHVHLSKLSRADRFRLMFQKLSDKENPSLFSARLGGLKSAIEGNTIAANPYAEDDPLFWQWMDAWCSTKMEILKLNARKE